MSELDISAYFNGAAEKITELVKTSISNKIQDNSEPMVDELFSRCQIEVKNQLSNFLIALNEKIDSVDPEVFDPKVFVNSIKSEIKDLNRFMELNSGGR